MNDDANIPKMKTMKEMEFDLALCAMLSDLLECKRTGKLPDPGLKKKVAQCRLDLEVEKYSKEGLPLPRSLKAWVDEIQENGKEGSDETVT